MTAQGGSPDSIQNCGRRAMETIVYKQFPQSRHINIRLTGDWPVYVAEAVKSQFFI